MEIGLIELLMLIAWFIVMNLWLSGILQGVIAIILGKYAKNILILLFFDILLLAFSFILVVSLDIMVDPAVSIKDFWTESQIGLSKLLLLHIYHLILTFSLSIYFYIASNKTIKNRVEKSIANKVIL